MNVMGNLPRHIAVIMDGNGRWAQNKGAARIFGHKNAIKAVRDTVEGCAELGIKHLTLFAFSTENWERPKAEVEALMSLLVSTISEELPTLMRNNISLTTIGDIEQLPDSACRRLREAMSATGDNAGLQLILALNYSGRWDLTHAMNRIGEKIANGDLIAADINGDVIANHLATKGIPGPELLIRTSGEQRISNFFLWQAAYTELYFTHVLWPDFRKQDLLSALEDYQKRERRFGKISKQVSAEI